MFIVNGIVLLEMVTGKSPTGIQTTGCGEMVGNGRLVTWVREKMNRAAASDKCWITTPRSSRGCTRNN